MSVSTGAAIAGGVLQLGGSIVAANAQQKAFQATAAASIAGENVRELQMKFETDRKKRQAVREAIVARSMSVAAGANQGALYGSGVKSGAGGAAGQGAENAQTAAVSEILGTRVFRANKAYHLASANAQAVMGVGSGIANIGGNLFNSSEALGRLFGG